MRRIFSSHRLSKIRMWGSVPQKPPADSVLQAGVWHFGILLTRTLPVFMGGVTQPSAKSALSLCPWRIWWNKKGFESSAPATKSPTHGFQSASLLWIKSERKKIPSGGDFTLGGRDEAQSTQRCGGTIKELIITTQEAKIKLIHHSLFLQLFGGIRSRK